jgi:hypothetical protein
MTNEDEGPEDEADLISDDELDRLHQELHQLVNEFGDRHDLPPELLGTILLHLAMSNRMMEYVFSAKKPSSLGLKQDLDRMQREFGDMIRHCKRTADEFLETTKKALEQARAEMDSEPESEQPTERKL